VSVPTGREVNSEANGFIAGLASASVGLGGAIVAGLVAAVFLIFAYIQWGPCSGWGAALLGLGLVWIGIAAIFGLPGSWVTPSVLCTVGVVLLLYGLPAATSSGCIPSSL
jgi:apolipoprotein N-acyltransferase